MITLTDSMDIGFELTAENEQAMKAFLIKYYSPDEIFLVEETGEKLRLGDIFDYD